MSTPANPKIYHITHIDNLSMICEHGLLSDELMTRRGGPNTAVGMSQIKERRLTKIEVSTSPGKFVGEFVPFYFCPRSVMLYLLYRSNHSELTYRGGQDPIVHLQADFHDVVTWAEDNGVDWAFTLGNAGVFTCEFRDDLSQLDELDWSAIGERDWSAPDVKEAKQAEFLVYRDFPWELIERIGTRNKTRRDQALRIIQQGGGHQPQLEAERVWYY